MVVITIIAALVGVSVTFFQDNLSEARGFQSYVAENEIRAALENYNLDHGTLVAPKEG
jgi:type II secretory pathway pseudopilin PulG